jgi:hypothetical protein
VDVSISKAKPKGDESNKGKFIPEIVRNRCDFIEIVVIRDRNIFLFSRCFDSDR